MNNIIHFSFVLFPSAFPCALYMYPINNRLIEQQIRNITWWQLTQNKQLASPIEEQLIGHQKLHLVLSARFPVVNWRSHFVAKSA